MSKDFSISLWFLTYEAENKIKLVEKREIPAKYSPIKHLWQSVTSVRYLTPYQVFIATNAHEGGDGAGIYLTKKTRN